MYRRTSRDHCCCAPARFRLYATKTCDAARADGGEGEEPVGSMGTDTPLACLSDKPQPLFNYFKQLFAQVTNPPIDPIREEMVMSLISYIGTERNILDETPQHCHTLKLPHPILTQSRPGEAAARFAGRFPGDHAADAVPPSMRAQKALERALDALCRARFAGHQVRLHAADPLRPRRGRGLRAHSEPAGADGGAQSPGARGTRTQVALIIESGEPREVMHFALLIGYGASAVNPYLAIETLENLAARSAAGGRDGREGAEQLTSRRSIRAC